MKYIYLITSPSGKKYIGKAAMPVWQKINIRQARVDQFSNNTSPIVNAIQRYGWDNMDFKIIDRNDNWTLDELSAREQFWINRYNTASTGYNVNEQGNVDDVTHSLWWRYRLIKMKLQAEMHAASNNNTNSDSQ
jgi:hypothetical protein